MFFLCVCSPLATCFATTSVTTFSPAKNALAISRTTIIQITFSNPINTATVNDTTSFKVTGARSGKHTGTFAYTVGNTVVTFTPTVPFSTGEDVMVDISSLIKDTSETAIKSFVYSFTVKASGSSGTFSDGGMYDTGINPQGIASADLDGDERPEIIVASSGSSVVSLWKNTGDGTFVGIGNLSTGDSPNCVQVGDVDGDGDVDIVAGEFTYFRVFKNDGFGNFDNGTDYSTGYYSISSFIYDLDGDGDNDIVSSNYISNTITVYNNAGDGSFGNRVDYSVGENPYNVFISDLDGDGDGDIVVTNFQSASVSILLNDGSGTFPSNVQYPVGASPLSNYVSDIDGDGDVDIVSPLRNNNSVSIIKNNGDGTFSNPNEYATGVYPYYVFVSDMDGDGDGDIVTANYGDNSVSLLRNDGGDTFPLVGNYGVGVYPTALVINDIQGDGINDIIVSNSGSSSFSVLKGNGFTLTVNSVHGTVSINPNQLQYAEGTPVTLTAVPNSGYHFISWSGDTTSTVNPIMITMNRDRNLTANYGTDVTGVSPSKNSLANAKTTTIQISFAGAMNTSSFHDTTSFLVTGMTSGRHKGTFSFSNDNSVITFTPTTEFKSGEMVVVNLSRHIVDADSNSINPVTYYFSIRTNEASGEFSEKVDFGTGAGPVAMVAADIDNDGDVDLVTANYDGGTISTLKNTGNGTFATKVDYTVGGYPSSIFVYDINRDGYGDIFVGNASSSSVSVLNNNGDGTFASKMDYPVGGTPYAVTVGDIDGDSDGDMIVANSNRKATILKNNGDGTYAAKVEYSVGILPFGIALGDIDGDGLLDIALANYGSANVSVLMNTGNGIFGAKVDYSTGNGPYFVRLNDINGDGYLDLLTANFEEGTVSTLQNTGNGSFATNVDYVVGGNPYSVFVEDMDGDDDGDLLVATDSSTISFLKNNGNGTFGTKINYQTDIGSTSVIASDIDGDEMCDILAANQGASSISILKGKGFSLTVNPSIGSVTINPELPGYHGGASITVTATAPTGYKFVRWSGTFADASNPLTFTIHSHTSLTAVFGAIVTAVSPAKNALNVSSTSSIQVSFAVPVLPATFNDTSSFTVSGITSGSHRGTFTFTDENTTVTFTPTLPFLSGELVKVDVSNKITDTANRGIEPVVYSFTGKTNKRATTFGSHESIGIPDDRAFSIFVSDIDGDDDGDLIYASEVYLYLSKNNGDGTFASKTALLIGANYRVYVCDLDGDGDPDIAAAQASSSGVVILTNNGDGTFTTKGTFETSVFPNQIIADDFNGDGKNDLAVITFSGVSIMMNNGNATFQPKVDYTTGSFSNNAGSLGDIDNDGDIDITVTNFGSSNVSIFKNNGDGTFTLSGNFSSYFPLGCALSDLDGDGDIDLAITSGIDNSVSILKNDGNGIFSQVSTHTSGNQPSIIIVSDFDGDGNGDIVNGNFIGAPISYYKNAGSGIFNPAVYYSTGQSPRSIFASDLDNDGDLDLAVANITGGIVLYKGTLNSLSISAENGTVTTNPDQSEYLDTARVTLTATANEGYRFTGWTGDTVATMNPLTITMNISKTIHANFVKQFALNVSAIHGTVSRNPSHEIYDSSSVVELTAIPDRGYTFTKWIIEDSVFTVNPLSTTMDSNVNVTAYFEIIRYPVNITALHGQVLRSPEKSLYNPGDTVIIQAISDAGYRFAGWMGDVTGIQNPDTIIVDTTKNVTASFQENVITLHMNSEWNLFSLPYQTTSTIKNQLFPTAISHVFLFQGAYIGVDTLHSGKGYWVRFHEAVEETVLAQEPLLSHETNVQLGWNMIGSLSSPIAVSNITSEPAGIVTSYFFGYNNGYVVTDTLFPGKGYWVRTNQSGTFFLSSVDKISSKNRIQIIPTREMPPPPPSVLTEDYIVLPTEFSLGQNYPNPFNPMTSINYTLPVRGFVSLKVYSMLGQEVATLVNGMEEAGYRYKTFNASLIPSGVYLYRINVESTDKDGTQHTFTDVKRMVLIK